jgi:hypothetical protein
MTAEAISATKSDDFAFFWWFPLTKRLPSALTRVEASAGIPVSFLLVLGQATPGSC